MRVQAAFSLAVAALLLGCPIALQARMALENGASERVRVELTKRTDADSLAAAGLLSVVKHRDQSLAFLDRAVRADPARADLVWLELRVCDQTPPCDSEPMERRLRVLDPANGAGWLGALARADSRKDNEATQAALAAIARSPRVDVYWTTLIAKLSRAISQTKTVSLGDAGLSVIGILAAEAIPAYRVASDACKGEGLQHAEVVELCRGIANAFQHGDTYLTEAIGNSIAMRVWPEQSPQWQAANDARRAFQYRANLATTLEKNWSNERVAQTLVELSSRSRREQDVVKTQLIEAGLRPDPP